MLFIAELAIRRGLNTWPKGAKWPTEVHLSDESQQRITREASTSGSDDSAAQTATRKLAESRESELTAQTKKQDATEAREMPSGKAFSGADNIFSDFCHRTRGCGRDEAYYSIALA